jgi:hypothetical protein
MDKQLPDYFIYGAAGVATSILQKIHRKKKMMPRDIFLELGLAACSLVAAHVMSLVVPWGCAYRPAIYWVAGWIGSRVLLAIDRRSEDLIDKAIDHVEDRL